MEEIDRHDYRKMEETDRHDYRKMDEIEDMAMEDGRSR